MIWVVLAYEGDRWTRVERDLLREKHMPAEMVGWICLLGVKNTDLLTSISCCYDGVMGRKKKGARTRTSNKMQQHRITMGWLALGE